MTQRKTAGQSRLNAPKWATPKAMAERIVRSKTGGIPLVVTRAN